jgi:glycosyltransferase involved in cell wall biosynthesis
VGLACDDFGLRHKIENAGLCYFPVPFSRASLSPLAVLRAAVSLRNVTRRFSPDLLHAVALRPVLITSIAQRSVFPPRVNAITGMGSLFSGELTGFKFGFTRRLVERWLRYALSRPGAWNVFQNTDDMNFAIASRIAPAQRTNLIRGAGVECQKWIPRPEPAADPPVILFISRLLLDKGVRELIEASEILRQSGIKHELRIAGDRDPANPNSFTPEQIVSWQKLPQVKVLGWRDDVLEQMSQANVIVLPTYREGLPKTLLDAGVARRAVVTCDVIGCREVITHNENGFLVPPRDPRALADAIGTLINDSHLREQFGDALRKDVEAKFSLSFLVAQFVTLYDRVLAHGTTA